MTWQPINTAPKDGTEFLATDYDCITIVSGEDPPRAGAHWYDRDGDYFYPCLWQPLPEVPELPEQGNPEP